MSSGVPNTVAGVVVSVPLELIESIPILLLEGTPEEMGHEHGRLLKNEIGLLVDGFVRRSNEIFGVPYHFLLEQSARCANFIPSMYLEEMRAIAEGCEVPYADILALNCIADVDGCYMGALHQCCNFVLLPSVTRGRLIHGRNLDFPLGRDIHARVGICIARSPASETLLPTISPTIVGMVGTYTGMSAARLSLSEVSTPASDCDIEGVPISIVLRMVLEKARNLADALEIVKNVPRTCGYNLALADGKSGEAGAIEFTRSLCAWRSARRGTLIVDDCCQCPQTARNRLTYSAGTFRYARMRTLIEEHRGALCAEAALRFLRDKYDGATGRENGKSYNCICNHHTIQSVLMFPAEMSLAVAHEMIPAPDGEYRLIDMSSIWAQYHE
ncbi:MAG: hypothetical protein K8Q91_03760 [Candidatus Vogelbacteria bacterium]|nr:hypothetical protein [Candidatus Vogelbacteria bacterium]